MSERLTAEAPPESVPGLLPVTLGRTARPAVPRWWPLGPALVLTLLAIAVVCVLGPRRG